VTVFVSAANDAHAPRFERQMVPGRPHINVREMDGVSVYGMGRRQGASAIKDRGEGR
jgi:hypothetical protein